MAQVAAAPAGGLSTAEAAGLARYGPNELPRARPTPLWRLVADRLRDPLILVLLAAVVLTVATGDLADASVIVLVIVVNTTVGVVQEVKAGQAIAALSDLTAPEARVVRDGGQRQIPAAEVVTGDVLVLAEGDIVRDLSQVPDQGPRGPFTGSFDAVFTAEGDQDSRQPAAGAQSERDLRNDNRHPATGAPRPVADRQ